jgi:hypothetical protein
VPKGIVKKAFKLVAEFTFTLTEPLRDAVPLADTLALLRKLVGVISLTDGVIITLSTTSVGAVHTLLATPSVADKLLVYVPNSAATGLYTGSGADGSGGGATGAAGGVLGYPGSTYPDPNGLAAIANKIPIKANGITPIVIQPDADALFPSGITLSGADSSGTSAGVVEVRGGTSTGVGGAGGSAVSNDQDDDDDEQACARGSKQHDQVDSFGRTRVRSPSPRRRSRSRSEALSPVLRRTV